MTYTIVSASYANPKHTAAVMVTEEAGAVAVSLLDTPALWAALHEWGSPIEFVEPTPSPPAAVSSAQAKLALDAAGLLDGVEAMIAAHPVRAVRIWFADANVWERSHPYLSALGAEMSLDDDAIDALFAAASLY